MIEDLSQDRHRLLSEIADLYYNEGLSQQEIAERVQMSRPSISRLLLEARDNSIVEIKINYPIPTAPSLEEELIKRFSLRSAHILERGISTDDDSFRNLGRLGAEALPGCGSFRLFCRLGRGQAGVPVAAHETAIGHTVRVVRGQPADRCRHHLRLDQGGAVHRRILRDQTRVGEAARNQNVEADPGSFQFLSPGTTGRFQRCLGRSVGGVVAPKHGIEAGGHIDDSSPTLLDHVRRSLPCQHERALEVDVHQALPAFDIGFPKTQGVVHMVVPKRSDSNAGVVDQNVDIAEL